MKIVAATLMGDSDSRPRGSKRLARQALLQQTSHAATQASSKKARPLVQPTPDILSNCGLTRHRKEFAYGQAVFGSVSQFASTTKCEYALGALANGFTPSLAEGQRLACEVKWVLAGLTHNPSIQNWPLLAFSTPITVSMAMNTAPFTLTRELIFDEGQKPVVLPHNQATKMTIGSNGSPLSLEIPTGDRVRLFGTGQVTPAARPTLIAHRTTTRLTVHSGRYHAVADDVGLLGWESKRPDLPIRYEDYTTLLLPADNSPEAPKRSLTIPPAKPRTRSIYVNNDLVGEFAPALDVWMIDPVARPGGAVDGYLVRVLFAPEGQIVSVSSSRREMNHILARGTLIETLLRQFLNC
jgi:hypothetical protein